MTSLFSMSQSRERSACGVGFLVRRHQLPDHATLQKGLLALSRVEHRGAYGADGVTGDGSGIMTEIPFELLGLSKGIHAVATLFVPSDVHRGRAALQIFEETFKHCGLSVEHYRDVPVRPKVLGRMARETLPRIVQAIISRPPHCATEVSFERLLYTAKQRTRTGARDKGLATQFFFVSLSASTIVYKALCQAPSLAAFYPDLANENFNTRFALYHRRFSTNTTPSWDKVQPFRLIAHNGEINTIAGNRAWSASREKSLGVPYEEVLTARGISDSGTLNEVVEALKYRSSIPKLSDILAIMVPPAVSEIPYYRFWSRAMEPWDGPAFLSFCDGAQLGARMDRNGFRPCRWTLTDSHFYLSSEAGSFDVNPDEVREKGALNAGGGVSYDLKRGTLHFEDPSLSDEQCDAAFDSRLVDIQELKEGDSSAISDLPDEEELLKLQLIFGYSKEDLELSIRPMALSGREALGSMGDTAALAILSQEDRPIFDFFSHDFAQVTNPPFDYLRESSVTEVHTYLGSKPNIFEPKELIPPPRSILLSSPVLSSKEYRCITNTQLRSDYRLGQAGIISCCFQASHGEVGYAEGLRRIGREALELVENGCSVLVLTDLEANAELRPLSSLLALRAAITALDNAGVRLRASVVVATGEVRTTHQLACLIGFGATAVYPYLAFQTARGLASNLEDGLANEERLQTALEAGILKIMSKMGISVLRSYEGSELFTPIGLGPQIISTYFPLKSSPLGGVEVKFFAKQVLKRSRGEAARLPSIYSFKEHTKLAAGERHAMNNKRARSIQSMLKSESGSVEESRFFAEYLEVGKEQEPTALRHLLDVISVPDGTTPTENVESVEDITARFGSGAMSFGSLSAQAQRDIFVAMKMLGGRSNSGEGGENPFYFSEGISATTKQVASGRFGVNAEYLASGEEIQIKIAQGAKPGEGGQLMGIKVTPEIAQARHASPGIDLISPPPLHDIYSIEDLKQLIYEFKQFRPNIPVNVKLVSGSDIGPIAVGVAKAGADVIHIAGYDGGTGAAPLSSMKHAGLPWELGLVESHRALIESELRSFVRLRVDGGLHSPEDIVKAALLGAEEFDFGKLLLVAEGCIMARICEQNTCPTGIATHDPKFLAKYKGTPEGVVRVLRLLAEGVRDLLQVIGARSLGDIVGRTDLLIPKSSHYFYFTQRGLDFGLLLQQQGYRSGAPVCLLSGESNTLNSLIVSETTEAISGQSSVSRSYAIETADRAIPATLLGVLAKNLNRDRLEFLSAHSDKVDSRNCSFRSWSDISLMFEGSAGQGFGVFLLDGVTLRLEGEANDSVGKGMSGGRIVVVPPKNSSFYPEKNSIIGNCALYGATGGSLFVSGKSGDRFAVRNSGAIAVVDEVGLHACEYMTGGTVVILGRASGNLGAGMTGGKVFLPKHSAESARTDYLSLSELCREQEVVLKDLLLSYAHEVQREYLKIKVTEANWLKEHFVVALPLQGDVSISAEMQAA